MTFFVIVHSIMIVCYAIMTYFIWRGWKDNQLKKKSNTALRNSAIALVEDMQQKEIDKNEKLVAEAKLQVAAAMSAMKANMSSLDSGLYDPNDIINDPALLVSILTAIVVKYGDMRLGAKDMILTEKSEYVSIYIDTETKEVILSTEHDLEGDTCYFIFINPSDDETYH